MTLCHYNPDVYYVRSIPEAKAIILTPEDSTTEERWQTETPYFVDMICRVLEPLPRHRVLDYGCGIGRIAKPLIDKTGCMVIGADTSVTMRALAPTHVLSNRFLTCHPEMLGGFNGFHFAIAVWSLQHIPDLHFAVDNIHRNLRSFGKLFVVNMRKRAIPMNDGTWHDDGKDVRDLLAGRFQELDHGDLDPEQTTPSTARNAFWGVYQRRS